MANPNIVNVTSIIGKTQSVNLTSAGVDVLENSVESGIDKVLKVNSLYIANIHESNDAYVDVKVDGTEIVKNLVIPAGSTAVVIDKNSHIYLEESMKIDAIADGNDKLKATISYEEIS